MGRCLVGKGRNGFWTKQKWAKMKLGEMAKGKDRYWAEWEKGEKGIGETRKIRAKWEWAEWDWANWE